VDVTNDNGVSASGLLIDTGFEVRNDNNWGPSPPSLLTERVCQLKYSQTGQHDVGLSIRKLMPCHVLQIPYDIHRLVEGPTFLARIRPFRSSTRHCHPFLQSIFLVHLCKSFRCIYHLNNIDPILERTDWECDECNKVWIRKRNASKVT
jgi:hypothetical protein